jgi:hypothetical protein
VTRPALLAAGLLFSLAGAAHSQPAAVKGCEVEVGSRTGGIIQVLPASQVKGAAAPQVIWQPTATGPGVMLLVIYGDGGLTHMDEPNAVLIRFRTPGARADSLSVSVKARGGRAWRFDGASIVSDADNLSHIAFGLDWPYGRGVIAATAEGQPLSVSVEQDGQVLASSAFGLDNIDARDTLLAQARARFQANDPADCRPARPAG